MANTVVNDTDNAILQEKIEELKKLKAEVRQLRGLRLAYLMENDPVEAIVYKKMFDSSPDSCYVAQHGGDALALIKKLCLRIHLIEKDHDTCGGHFSHSSWEYINKDNYEVYFCPARIKQTMLTPAQRLMSAKCADEIVNVFNSFVREANPNLEFFGENINPWQIAENVSSIIKVE